MALLGKLGNYKNFGLLIIRLGLGVMFIWHGYPKLMEGPGGWKELGASAKVIHLDFLPMLWGFLSAVTEAVGGILLILGLAFRPVCLLLVINLVVAALVHLHQGGEMGGLSGASHAIEDAVTFAGLLFIGPGRYSVDKK